MPGTPGTRPGQREGLALVLVLIVCLLIFGSLVIVFQSMQQGQMQRKGVDSYVRAIFIAESGFNRLYARLQATGWDERWFRDGPAIEEDVAYSGGKYSTLITDSASGPRTADILVTGRHEKSTVRMVWRLRFEEQALSLFPQISTIVFRYVDEQVPEGSRDMAPLMQKVQQIIDQRRANEERTDLFADAVRLDPTLTEVLETIGQPDPSAVTQVTGLPAQGASPPGTGLAIVPPLPVPALIGPGVPIPVPQVNPTAGTAVQPGEWWARDPTNEWSRGPTSLGSKVDAFAGWDGHSSGGH